MTGNLWISSGKKKKTLKRYFFKVYPAGQTLHLQYYGDVRMFEYIDRIPLDRSTKIKEEQGSPGQPGAFFSITYANNSKVMTLKAATQELRGQWMTAIKSHIDYQIMSPRVSVRTLSQPMNKSGEERDFIRTVR